MQTLNEYQIAAVTDEHRACVVNANVGSGKTTVLIGKIAWLKKEKQVDYKDMVVLTFTNKAANEIRDRLKEPTEDLYFGTFHSVAMHLLAEVLPVEELQYSKDFQIMLPEEELEIARQLIITENFEIKYKNRLKKRMETYEKKGMDSYQDDLGRLMAALRQEKLRQNKMTYRDLLLHATELLKKHPELFSPKWVIIDEVQDSDADQLEFIDALMQEETRLFAVGDPNQVIYGWRGSAFQIFSLLKKRYGAVELSLPINYRSSKVILQAASRFKQSGEMLVGAQDAGEKIRITDHYDPFAEADYLAGRIQTLHEEGVPYSEIGIFYRLQNQSEVLAKVLERYEIPYEVSKKQQFFEIPIIRWLYHLCRYLVNETDQISLLQVITDKQYGDQLTEKKALKLLAAEQVEKIPVIEQVKDLFPLEMPSAEWVNKLKQAIRLERRIGLTSSTFQEESSMADFFFTELLESKKDLLTFVNEAALYGISFAKEENTQKEEKVQLLTLHASKGLEFTHVFLIGMNPGLMPLHNAKEEEAEEEMRLLFVGMTRAKKYLELSYYQNSPQPLVQPGPSPYLRMIKSEWVEQPIAERKDMKASAEHLQKIKRELLRARNNVAALQPAVGQEALQLTPGQEVQQPAQSQAASQPTTGQAALQSATGQEAPPSTTEQATGQVALQPATGQTALQQATVQEAMPSTTEQATGQVALQPASRSEQQSAATQDSQEKRQTRILHPRYGKGTIVREDENQVVIDFDDFGEKEMLRMFSNFTIIEE